MSMQQAIAIGGAETSEPSAVEALRTTLRGAVLVPAEGAIRSRNPASRRNSACIGEPPCGPRRDLPLVDLGPSRTQPARPGGPKGNARSKRQRMFAELLPSRKRIEGPFP